jgi:hypothetical protein
VTRIVFKLLKRAPILHHDFSHSSVTHKTGLRMGLKLFDHPGHGEQHGQPFVNLPDPVDPHPDQENHKLAIHFSGHPPVDYGSHIWPLWFLVFNTASGGFHKFYMVLDAERQPAVVQMESQIRGMRTVALIADFAKLLKGREFSQSLTFT